MGYKLEDDLITRKRTADGRPVQPVIAETQGINFAQADTSQEQTLRAMEDAYKSGGDWLSGANALGADGNFVSVGNNGGAPTGAYRSISGESNGSMLWGLNGQMANTGVSEGTQLIAPDGSYWQVGAGGALSPYEAAIAAVDAGNPRAADLEHYGNVVRDKTAAANGSLSGTPSGSPSGSYAAGGSSSFSSSAPAENPYAAAISAFDYGPAPQWGGTEYERRRDAALQRAEDMRFNYDPSTDPSWLAYQKQYRREGQRATADALGQAAAMTSGSPSSYAVTAASQAGDYHAAQLSDRLPQLYQDAYNRYLQEYQRQLGIADAYAGYGQTEYNRYLDRLGQYNTDRNFAYGAYRDQVGDQQWADKFAYQKERDAVGDEQWQTQWAQELREYEDKLAQQARENGWYEREYADALRSQQLDDDAQFYNTFKMLPKDFQARYGLTDDQMAQLMGTQAQTAPSGTGSWTDLGTTPPGGGDGEGINKFPQLAAYLLDAAKLGTGREELQRMMDTYYDNGWITKDQYNQLAKEYNENFGNPATPVFPGGTQKDMASNSGMTPTGAQMLMEVYDAVQRGDMSETQADSFLSQNGLGQLRNYLFTSEQGRDLISGYTGKKSANFDKAAQALIDEYNNNPTKSGQTLLRLLRTYNLSDDENRYLVERFGLA